VREAVFAWVLERLAEHGLIKGHRIGVNASTMEANAALSAVGAAPTPTDPAEPVADKSYHSREGLKDLADGAWKSRAAEKKQPDVSRWQAWQGG
jgi:hypothetical protein